MYSCRQIAVNIVYGGLPTTSEPSVLASSRRDIQELWVNREHSSIPFPSRKTAFSPLRWEITESYEAILQVAETLEPRFSYDLLTRDIIPRNEAN